MSLADPETNSYRKTPDVARTEPTSGKDEPGSHPLKSGRQRPGHDLPVRRRPGALGRFRGLEFRGQVLYPEANAGIPAQPEQGVHRQVRRRRTHRLGRVRPHRTECEGRREMEGPTPETAPHQPAHCPYQAGPGHHRERAGNAAPPESLLSKLHGRVEEILNNEATRSRHPGSPAGPKILPGFLWEYTKTKGTVCPHRPQKTRGAG